MVTTIAFLNPQYAWLLLTIPLLAFFLYMSLALKKRTLLLFQNSAHFVASLRFIKLLPVLAIVLLLIVSLTQPISGYEDVTIPAVRSDLLLVVDISQSMRADDLKPSRLTLAKRKIFDALDILEETQEGVRVGIILFAGSAYVYCPLTEDYSVIRIFAESINTSLISDPGSDMLAALRLALSTLQVVGAKDPRVVLLSDGEESSSEKSLTLEKLETYSVPIDSIALGTSEGAPIKLASGRFLRHNDGNFVVSKLNTELLQQVSQTTRGIFQFASPQPSDIRAVINQIQSKRSESDTLQGSEKIRLYREVGPYFVLAAFGCLTLFVLFRFPSLVFMLVFFLIYTRPASADPSSYLLPSETAQHASRAYRSGDYEAASTLYREALKASPKDRVLQEGLAASLYKTKNFRESAELYDSILKDSKTGRALFEASYNAGNAHLLSGNPEMAIDLYENALRYKPGDTKTADNLALAKLLKEQQKKPENDKENKPEKQSPQEKNKEQEEQKEDQQSNEEKDKNRAQKKEESSEKHDAESKEKEAGTEERKGESGTRDEPSKKENKEQNSVEENKENQKKNPEGESLESLEVGDQDKPPAEASPENDHSDRLAKHSKNPLSKADAAQWLNSLPDSPVLLRQKGGRGAPGDQLW